jgi:guanylate kinase
LVRLHGEYRHFQKLKVGSGRTEGYRIATPAEADRLEQRGHVLYENRRYGNRYLVDRPSLDSVLATGCVPVVHMGQVVGVRVLSGYRANWLSVLLWCPRRVAEDRIRRRSLADLDVRLAAWDEIAADIKKNGTGDFALRIDTDQQVPETAARAIHTMRLAHARGATRT